MDEAAELMSNNTSFSSRWTPVVIIGSPRSGTNILRNVLTELPGVATWPCDEINYIWRHGNVRYSSDEFTSDMANFQVVEYIRQCFGWVANRYDAEIIVEKTCANSLRVGFVERVLPEAKYVFIYRDGLDAVGSSMKRWKAKLDLGYILRKARFVPPADFLHYGIRYLGYRMHRLVSREKRLAFWGPKLNGMKKLLQNYALDEVCAMQWKRCVDTATNSFDNMSSDKYIKVAYENFVLSPEEELERVLHFIGKKIDYSKRKRVVVSVHTRSIGKGRKILGEESVKRLMPLIHDTMNRYNYA